MTAHAAIPAEIEAKLFVPRPAILSAIARLQALGPYRLRPQQTLRLHTIYLDTGEFTLARHGVALRLRRNRTRWEASLKWSGREDGMVHTRPELTVRLSRPPSFPFTVSSRLLAAQLSPLITGQALVPILISDVRRQRRAVRVNQQGKTSTFAELALDHVRLSAPGPHRHRTDTYDEIEIELQPTGTTQDLLNFAKLLQTRFALTPTQGSKFSRGLALLYGPELFATQPRTARKKARMPIAQQ
ncbi:MAG TPA: CYTH domain-containing protein [Candidatus Binatia bacterium]|jgi:inorganic triphosphatase YgiF|nr:CYTH domain-containing protein [Candidatus Binatia bacterium]